MLVYVDDILVAGKNQTSIDQVKKLLGSQFHMIGIEVDESPKGIFISQRKYTLDILKEYKVHKSRVLKVPMDPHMKLTYDSGEPLPNPIDYQHLVGKLIYLTINRSDITFAIHVLSQFMHSPTCVHIQAARRVLIYLLGTSQQGVFLASTSGAILIVLGRMPYI